MRLSNFIISSLEPVLQEWEDFAATIAPAGQQTDKIALRDHVKRMLETISLDLSKPETEWAEIEKSTGNNNSPPSAKTAATTHGIERLALGFSLNAAVAEYRALRASVTRMWKKSLSNEPLTESMVNDLIRFNEAIDQSINESVTSYSFEKEQQTRIFDTILSSLPDMTFTLTLQGRFTYVNKAMTSFFAQSVNELLGKNFLDLGVLNGPDLQRHVIQVIQTGKQFRAEMAHTFPSGQLGFYEYILAPAFDQQGMVEAIVGTAREITERKMLEQSNWQKANYDQLSGLPNRRLFLDRLDQELKHGGRAGKQTALLFIDLDHFKEANDQFGHETGDRLLRLTSTRLSGCIRETDTLARLGGDEFTIILQDITDTAYVEMIAGKILSELATPFPILEHTIYISGSIGIALAPQDSSNPEVLITCADQAMYFAKNAGRNQFSFYRSNDRRLGMDSAGDGTLSG